MRYIRNDYIPAAARFRAPACKVVKSYRKFRLAAVAAQSAAALRSSDDRAQNPPALANEREISLADAGLARRRAVRLRRLFILVDLEQYHLAAVGVALLVGHVNDLELQTAALDFTADSGVFAHELGEGLELALFDLELANDADLHCRVSRVEAAQDMAGSLPLRRIILAVEH